MLPLHKYPNYPVQPLNFILKGLEGKKLEVEGISFLLLRYKSRTSCPAEYFVRRHALLKKPKINAFCLICKMNYVKEDAATVESNFTKLFKGLDRMSDK